MAPTSSELTKLLIFSGVIPFITALPTIIATIEKSINMNVGKMTSTANKILYQYCLRLEVPVKSPPRRKKSLTPVPKLTPRVPLVPAWTGNGVTSCFLLGKTRITKFTKPDNSGTSSTNHQLNPLTAKIGPTKPTTTRTRYHLDSPLHHDNVEASSLIEGTPDKQKLKMPVSPVS